MRTSLILAAAAFLALAQADSWQAHHDAVQRALARKQYDVAVREAKAGLDSVAQNGPSDPRYIRSLMDQADTQRNDVAVDTLRRALESAETAGALAKDAALGDELRGKLAQTLVVLVRDSSQRLVFREVENYMRQALAVIAGLSKNQDNLLPSAMSSLGFALGRQGYDVAAAAVFRRGLAVREDASLLSDLAEVVYRQGFLADAEALLRRAIDLDARTTPAGGSQSSAFDRLYRLAVLNIEREQYPVAEALLGQARQSGYGNYAEIVLSQALGNLACARRQFDSAKDRFRQALAASQDPGRGYLRGEILIDMGRCAIKEKDFDSAAASLQEAKSIFDRSQRNHPAAAHILWQQALMLEAQKKAAEAQPLLIHAISILETAAGAKTPIVGSALLDLARIRKTIGQAPAAEELISRARAIPRASDVRPLPVVDKDLTLAKAAELAYWDSIQDREDAALFRQYLSDFPKGQFVAVARQRGGQPLPALVRGGSAVAPGPGAACPREFDAVPAADLTSCILHWKESGYSPVTLAAYWEDKNIFFAGAFEKSQPRLVTPLLTVEEFEADLEIYRSRGQRPATISLLAGPEGPRFSVTWTKLESNVTSTFGPVNDALSADIRNNQSKNLVNTLLFVYLNPGPKYVAVWEGPRPGVETRSYFDLTNDQLGENWNRFTKQGFHSFRCLEYATPSGVRWAEIWIKEPAGAWYRLRGMDKARYASERDKLSRGGLSLAEVSVFGNRFNGIWIKR